VKDIAGVAHNCAVMTSVSKYTRENIRVFTSSLKRTGFSGRKLAVVFTAENETIQHLEDEGFEIYSPESQKRAWGLEYVRREGMAKENVFSDRFLRYAELCKGIERGSNVLACDCRDVAFQKDPGVALQKLLERSNKSIICSLEGARIMDEDWSRENMKENFPEIYEYVKEREIANAGVIGGKASSVEDLFLSIYLVSLAGRKHARPILTSTDQSAYNIIIRQDVWEQKTLFADNGSEWTCQIGTYLALSGSDNWNQTNNPRITDGIFYNDKGEEYSLVHQYDRVGAWRDALEKRYQ